ncbi:diacylglycerol/lipid kinase family protein [Bacillus sp. T33-2]|uniref:diacylglycerol/lipid kinase family protein n=1 Tax=Bacillus sp. T33-2 TaxID=2054168 RepID=UPI0021554733|nr:YegS/Rv2252/BmrU family lipid kinase [Bacillus sp. T33-2]
MKQFKKAMLIYNGSAGQKDLETTLRDTIPLLGQQLGNLLLLQTDEPGHAKELCRQYGPDMDLAVILGGDGTVHECINGLAGLGKRPVLAVLPGGTCNDFTRTLETPQNLRRAAMELLEGEVVPVDAMRADNSYFMNFWGVGLVTETSNNINEAEKALFGKMSYFLSAIRTIKQMKPFRFKVTVDNENITDEAVALLLVNGRFIGTRELPFQNVHIDDGYADLFIIKNTNFALLREILAHDITATENPLTQEILHFRGREFVIETDSELDADTDGEVYSKTPAHITVLKHHFDMLKPRLAILT